MVRALLCSLTERSEPKRSALGQRKVASATNASVRKTPLLRSLAQTRADNNSRANEAESWWPPIDRHSSTDHKIAIARNGLKNATISGLSLSSRAYSMSTLSLIFSVCRSCGEQHRDTTVTHGFNDVSRRMSR